MEALSISHSYSYQAQAKAVGRVKKWVNAYRFGFNGQMKSDELAGVGNHNTAMFWEYDTRLGRRWNLDPVDQISISNYSTFGNNPVRFSDLLGDKKGDAVLKDDNIGAAGSVAPNGGTLQGDGSIVGGDGFCKGCGPRGEDTWGDADPGQLFGGGGTMNLVQAAAADVGRNDENRKKVAQFGEAMNYWMAIGALPFTIPAAAEVGASSLLVHGGGWAYKNLITNGGKFASTNVASGAGDLAYQLATNNPEDVNMASVGANTFLGPLPAAALGYTFTISANSLRNPNRIYTNPFTKTGLLNIGVGTTANYGAGKLGELLGIPRLRINQTSVPNIFGPSLNIGTNAAGNAVGNKIINKIDKR